ncbi:MAG: trypsin-like peptidase domain-containing protein [Luteolibacter sp.]
MNGTTGSPGPVIAEPVIAMRSSGGGTYVGGGFTAINGSPVSKIAFLVTAQAPVVGIDQGSGKILVTRGYGNGSEVPFFQVTGITGGTLRRSGGSIVSNGEYLSFAEGLLGLVWTPVGGGIPSFQVRAGLAADPSALGTLATVVNPSNGSLQPLILFEKAEVPGVEDQGSIEVKVRYTGNSSATVRIALTAGSAIPVKFSPGPVGDYFDPGIQTLSFTGPGTKSLLLPLWNDSDIESDEVLYADLSSATGALIGGPGRSRILLIENDVFGTSIPGVMKLPVPVLPAPAAGSLAVNLIGDDDKGQWRLSGEVDWRNSSDNPGGAKATGLTGGNYKVEFRPADGLLEPAVITVPVGASETVTKTGIYANGSLFQPGTGLLEVVVEPEGVADEADLPKRGQWKRQGDAVWRNSGDLLEVSAGLQVVQFKEVDERETPPDRTVSVRQGQHNGTSGIYLFRSQIPNARQADVLPLSVPVGGAAAVGKAPYCFNGQIATELGYGSGVVTQEHTVLTAAHVLFDDIALAQAKRVEWFFQRHKGQNESPGLIPRGWYRFEGYASQRALDVVSPSFGPGIGTVDSQNLDVAVMYFLGPAGRGGYGGYQVSETTANKWLLGNRDKFLAGYPIVDVSETNRGRVHATSISNDHYNLVRDFVLSTRDIESRPGNSGGPVYAWDENALSGQGAFFPVAVYLGGTGDTTVRAINNGVVSLMNLAETAGNAGGNGTGGGATYTSLGFTEDGLPRGFVTVKITDRPTARWRLLDATGKVLSTFTKSNVALAITPGDVFFELEPLAGLPTAGRELVTVFNGQLTTKTATYPVSYDSWAQTELITRGATGPTGPLADYDKDGIVHLLEYAFALNPMVADRKTLVPGSGTSGLPSVRLTGEGANAKIRVEYVRRQSAAAPGVSYRVEMAASPSGPWEVSGSTETVTPIDETWERVVVDASETAGTRPKYFGRVRVTLN